MLSDRVVQVCSWWCGQRDTQSADGSGRHRCTKPYAYTDLCLPGNSHVLSVGVFPSTARHTQRAPMLLTASLSGLNPAWCCASACTQPSVEPHTASTTSPATASERSPWPGASSACSSSCSEDSRPSSTWGGQRRAGGNACVCCGCRTCLQRLSLYEPSYVGNESSTWRTGSGGRGGRHGTVLVVRPNE